MGWLGGCGAVQAAVSGGERGMVAKRRARAVEESMSRQCGRLRARVTHIDGMVRCIAWLGEARRGWLQAGDNGSERARAPGRSCR